ncbi:hypothetical protein PR048_003479 [Dryococelus australis]|uniref:Titin n=1 Tax=Dryococelus australis TaxID=614101 RepID=A0ABQ9IPI5_9NEOP|nr:hypothetical protein PR048_003479 [Dryococelus australis]
MNVSRVYKCIFLKGLTVNSTVMKCGGGCVFVEAAPSIRLPRQYEVGLVFEKDEVLRLKVGVAGRPLPRVAWLRGGHPIVFGGRHEVRNTDKSSSLRVSDARRADSGEYQVRATNRLGEDMATFTVTVTDRAMPPGKPQIAMILGRSLTLSWTEPKDDGGCRIETYIVEYYRLGWNVWLKAATCRQLTTTLSDLIEGSEYRFRVKAENPNGVSDPSPESDVIFIPDPRRGLLQAPTRSRSITMGDVENRLRDDKVKRNEPNRMSKEINMRTTSAGALQTDRSSVIPKVTSKKVSSSEEIPGGQMRKVDTLPNTAAHKKERLEHNSFVGKEIPQKRVADSKPEPSSALKSDNSNKKTSDEKRSTNIPPVLREVPKVATEGNKPVSKTNIVRDAKGKTLSPHATEIKPESKSDAEVRKSHDDKELNHTTHRRAPPVIPETKEKEAVGVNREPDNSSYDLLPPNRKSEQYGREETAEKHFTSPLTPREEDDSIIHGSSELMLVLLPEVRKTKRTKGAEILEETGKTVPKDASPPRLSLSAPALDLRGSYVLPPLRNSVSSSQLLHEKAMARFYEAVAAEQRQLPRSPVTIRVNSVDVDSREDMSAARRLSEQDNAPPLRRTYQEYEADIDRVRSKLAAVGELKRQMAFRQSLSQEESDLGDAELEDEVYDDEEDAEAEEDAGDEVEDEAEEEAEEEEELEEEELESEDEEVSEEEDEVEDIEEAPKPQYKSSSYDSRKTLQQKLSSLSQDDEDYEDAEERTYHPRSMVPVTAHGSRLSESPEQEFKFARSEITDYRADDLDEELPRDTPFANYVQHRASPVEAEREAWRRDEYLGRRNEVSEVDASAGESSEQSGLVVMRPKRAEAPETPGQQAENIDADVALSAAEIARQRRLKVRQKSVEEDVEANQAIVSLYGDIIREYGSMRKTRTVMYLNTEDMKNAAYSSQELNEVQQPKEDSPPKEVEISSQVIKKPSNEELNHRHAEPKKKFGPQPKRKKPRPLSPPAVFPPPEVKTKEIRLPEPQQRDTPPVKLDAAYPTSPAPEAAKNALLSEEQRKMETAGKNVKFFVTFMTDLALFAVACWLYFFKDERLAIPVLVFMVYRQAMDAIKKRLPKRWTDR